MEIKAPTPQIPPAVWTEFKDLQEWEKYRQERPEGDKHSALFESLTEGIHHFPGGFVVTSVADAFLNWARKSSIWPVTFGLACCAIEMMATGAGRYDLARFGMEAFRASPRQADLMIVAGRVSQKMAPVLRQIYDQMAAPKWVLAMGVCASTGGMFNNYAIVQGVDHVVPVDMYLPGCPPRPEMLLDSILKLHDKIQHSKLGSQRAADNREREAGALEAEPTSQMTGLLR